MLVFSKSVFFQDKQGTNKWNKDENISSEFVAEKIAFPPKPDIRTVISNYRVASLLKNSTNLVVKFVFGN